MDLRRGMTVLFIPLSSLNRAALADSAETTDISFSNEAIGGQFFDPFGLTAGGQKLLRPWKSHEKHRIPEVRMAYDIKTM